MTSPDNAGKHTTHEDFPWTIAVVDHAPRKETAGYRASRTLMHKIIDEVGDWILEPGPYEDHHGGSLWVKDADGWLFVQQPLGIEWSAQFCADPAKIDLLRASAARIVAAFPLTIPAYVALGYHSAQTLLDTPITTAAQVSAWTDSIFNASMPVPAAAHTGVYPHGAGYHHYPKPIVDIEHFRRADFQLFVDDGGLPAVVVPVSSDPSDKRVRLIAAHPDAPHARLLLLDRGHAHGSPGKDRGLPQPGQPTFDDTEHHGAAVLDEGDDLARQAFSRVK